MIEHQIKDVPIIKDDCRVKSELNRLFWNIFVMYFNIYLDGSFFYILNKSKYTSHFLAMLENTINKLK